jgi:hypothetical protein
MSYDTINIKALQLILGAYLTVSRGEEFVVRNIGNGRVEIDYQDVEVVVGHESGDDDDVVEIVGVRSAKLAKQEPGTNSSSGNHPVAPKTTKSGDNDGDVVEIIGVRLAKLVKQQEPGSKPSFGKPKQEPGRKPSFGKPKQELGSKPSFGKPPAAPKTTKNAAPKTTKKVGHGDGRKKTSATKNPEKKVTTVLRRSTRRNANETTKLASDEVKDELKLKVGFKFDTSSEMVVETGFSQQMHVARPFNDSDDSDVGSVNLLTDSSDSE